MIRDLFTTKLGLAWLVMVGLTFLLASYKTWIDFQFAILGREGTARITKIIDGRTNRKPAYHLTVYYDFFDENRKQHSHGETTVDLNEVDRYREGDQVTIDYFGDEPQTRLHGMNNLGWVCFFLASTALLIALVANYVVKRRRPTMQVQVVELRR